MEMLEGKQVKEYFENHPEAVEIIERMEMQFVIPDPEKDYKDEDIYRPLTLEDVKFITFGGWCGEAGVFAWYYPCGVPHYTQIGE